MEIAELILTSFVILGGVAVLLFVGHIIANDPFDD